MRKSNDSKNVLFFVFNVLNFLQILQLRTAWKFFLNNSKSRSKKNDYKKDV